MKYNEIIYSIRESLRETVDDSNIDDREIIFNVNNQRALFYRNQYNQRNKIIDEDIVQFLYIPVSEVDTDFCNDTSCTILRSTNPIPNAIELHHKNAILNISSTDILAKQFSFVNWKAFLFSGNGKYSKNEVFVALHPNGYLYLKAKNHLAKFIDKITVEMILENPLEIKNFLDCNNEDANCFDLDTFEYPLKSYAFAYIKPQVLQSLSIRFQIPEDLKNDAESK